MGGKMIQTGTGMLGYDKANKKLVMHTYFTTGNIGMSHALDSKEPNTWRFAVRVGDEKPWNAARGIMKKLDKKYVCLRRRDAARRQVCGLFQGAIHAHVRYSHENR